MKTMKHLWSFLSGERTL